MPACAEAEGPGPCQPSSSATSRLPLSQGLALPAQAELTPGSPCSMEILALMPSTLRKPFWPPYWH